MPTDGVREGRREGRQREQVPIETVDQVVPTSETSGIDLEFAAVDEMIARGETWEDDRLKFGRYYSEPEEGRDQGDREAEEAEDETGTDQTTEDMVSGEAEGSEAE